MPVRLLQYLSNMDRGIFFPLISSPWHCKNGLGTRLSLCTSIYGYGGVWLGLASTSIVLYSIIMDANVLSPC